MLKKHQTIIQNYHNIDNAKLDNMLVLQGKIMSELNSHKTSSDIKDYEFKIFSQNGEDGIIQYLINKIDIKNKVFIEFGVENYTEANTRFLLLNNNWSGLIIDGSKEHMSQVCNSELGWRYDLKIAADFITKDNINDLIISNGIQGEIGILSVDIDGNDYWVYEAIECINPQILIIEYNSIFGKNAKVTVPYDKNFVRTQKHYSNLYYGASISALTELANKRGYDLVGSNTFGNNLFFVRHDSNTTGINMLASDAYVRSKFKESRSKEGSLTYLSHTEGLSLIADCEVYDIEQNKTLKIRDLKI